MLSHEKDEKFAAYLRASMTKSSLEKFGELCSGIAERGFSHLISKTFKSGTSEAKDLLFEQKLLLSIADKLTAEKPWISYFAALKHLIYLKSQGVDTSTFSDFKDKEYALEVEQYAESIALSAEKLIDDQTQEYLHELIELQQITSVLEQALVGLEMMAHSTSAQREAYINPPKVTLGSFLNPFNQNAPQDIRNASLSVYKTFITTAASQLKQDEVSWVRNPEDAALHLREIITRRKLLEDTYFSDYQLPQQHKPASLTTGPSRLYVGNLSPQVTKDDLFELFTGVGNVQSVEIIEDHSITDSTNITFCVEMQSSNDAARAIRALHDKAFKGTLKLIVKEY